MKRDGYGRHSRSIVRCDRPHTVTIDLSDRTLEGEPLRSAPLELHEFKALFDQMKSQRIPVVIFRTHDGACSHLLEQLIVEADRRHLKVGIDLGASWESCVSGPSRSGSSPESDTPDPAASTALVAELDRYSAAGLKQVELRAAIPHPDADTAPLSRLLDLADRIHDAGLKVGIRTPFALGDSGLIREFAERLCAHEVESWQVSFFDLAGAQSGHAAPTAADIHAAFADLYAIEQEGALVLSVVEAPHYRRYREDRETKEAVGCSDVTDQSVRDAVENQCGEHVDVGVARHVTDAGRPSVFIDHSGEVYPSERLPISAGNIREHALMDLYRNAPVFLMLRDVQLLEGKCARCGFRSLCRGSRARAWKASGNAMAADPACAFPPLRS
jgi:radical SAM protein with 4Fe4S-binding SPASM domain